MTEYNAGDAKLRIVPDASRFKRELESKLKTIQANFTVKVDLQIAQARADMARFRSEENNRNINQRVNPQFTNARAEMATFRAEQRANAIKIPVDVDANSVRNTAKQAGAQASSAFLSEFSRVSDGVSKAFSGLGDIGKVIGLTGLIANIPAAVTAVAALGQALGQLSAAALVVPGAIATAGASIGTLAVGLSGISDAYSAVTAAAAESATGQAEQARAAASATTSLRNAVVDEADAQKDVARARKDARQELQDLNLEMRGGQISIAQAENDARKARRDLAKGGFKDSLDARDAQLRVLETDQRVAEAKSRQTQLIGKNNEAQAKGVDGADQVVAANERLVRSHQAVASAQDAVTQATNGSNAAQDKAKAAMAALSPQAAAFVDTLIALKPRWDDLKKSTSGNLFEGASVSFTDFVDKVLPNLKTGMGSIAKAWNSNIKTLLSSLGAPNSVGLLDRILGNTAKAQTNFDKAIDPLVRGIGTLTAAGSDAVPRLATAIGDVATRFANFIEAADKDGRLAEWIDQGLTGFTDLGNILLNLGKSFFSINQAIGGPGLLASFSKLTEKWANFLASTDGQNKLKKFFEEGRAEIDRLKPLISNIIDILPAIWQGFKNAWDDVAPILQTVTSFLKETPDLVTGVTEAMAILFAAKGASNLISALNNITGILGKGIPKAAATAAGSGGIGLLSGGLSGLLTNPVTGPILAALAFGAGIGPLLNSGPDAKKAQQKADYYKNYNNTKGTPVPAVVGPVQGPAAGPVGPGSGPQLPVSPPKVDVGSADPNSGGRVAGPTYVPPDLNKNPFAGYETGGPAGAGLAMLHPNEFVLSDKAKKYPDWMKHGMNQGTLPVPHYETGGPYPPEQGDFLGPVGPAPSQGGWQSALGHLTEGLSGPLARLQGAFRGGGGGGGTALGGGFPTGVGPGSLDLPLSPAAPAPPAPGLPKSSPFDPAPLFPGLAPPAAPPPPAAPDKPKPGKSFYSDWYKPGGGTNWVGATGDTDLPVPTAPDIPLDTHLTGAVPGPADDGLGLDPLSTEPYNPFLQVWQNPDGTPKSFDDILTGLPDKLQPVNIAKQFGEIALGFVSGFFGLDTTYLTAGAQAFDFFKDRFGDQGDANDPYSGVDPSLTAGDGTLPTDGLLNPASQASSLGGAKTTYTPELLKSKGIAPLYTRSTDKQGNNVANIPAWAQQLAGAFHLTANSHVDASSLHGGAGSSPGGGWAFDFSGKPEDEQAFADFIKTNLSGQTLQLIWQNPNTGAQSGIAGGQTLGHNEYYTSPGGSYADHTDHVHWATDVQPNLTDPTTGKSLLSAGSRAALSQRYGGTGGGRPGLGRSTPGGGAQGWRSTVRAALQRVGPSLGITNYSAWENALIGQIQFESGGDPNALNPNDSDGLPAIGLGQFKSGTFQAHNITHGSINDGTAQVYAMIDYVAKRYGQDASGTPNYINQGHGYATGGMVGIGQVAGVNPFATQNPGLFGRDAKIQKKFRAQHWQDFQPGFNLKALPINRATGGDIPGSGTGDTVDAKLTPGEHVLTTSDVKAMGGQAGVYDFRRSLHFAEGGDVARLRKLAAAVPPPPVPRGPAAQPKLPPPPRPAVPRPAPAPAAPAAPAAPSVPTAPPPSDQFEPAPQQPSGESAPPAGAVTGPAGEAPDGEQKHLLPAVSTAITSGAAAIGSAVDTAVAAATFGATAGMGGGLAGAGGGGGGGGGLSIGGIIQQGGKVVKDIAEVGASFLVGNVTGGTIDGDAYGETYKPQQKDPQTAALNGDNNSRSYIFNGIDSRNVVDEMRLKDAQDHQAVLARW